MCESCRANVCLHCPAQLLRHMWTIVLVGVGRVPASSFPLPSGSTREEVGAAASWAHPSLGGSSAPPGCSLGTEETLLLMQGARNGYSISSMWWLPPVSTILVQRLTSQASPLGTSGLPW